MLNCVLPSPGEIATIKAEIKRLEKARAECTDSGLQKRIQASQMQKPRSWLEPGLLGRRRFPVTRGSHLLKSLRFGNPKWRQLADSKDENAMNQQNNVRYPTLTHYRKILRQESALL
jgi:hypothetical protein